jgi:hypothetical protein
MESIEQRKQKVIGMIELLKGELDNLMQLELGPSSVSASAGSNRYLLPSDPVGDDNAGA